MAGNSVLNKSKLAQDNDEFYTTYDTVEKELQHYEKKLVGKVILCNCDDPFESSFSKYFIKNFNRLQIKKLVCTSYSSSKVVTTESDLFDSDNEPITNEYGYVLSITRVPQRISDKSTDEQVHAWLKKRKCVKKLNGTGDFRSDECIEYLKKADVIITNPPFSLFKEMVSLVMKYKKQFLLIGNANAILYKEIFPLIRNNQVWIGNQFGEMAFKVPSDSEARTYRFWIDEFGQKWRSLGNAMWLTNIDINRRHKELELTECYTPEQYPKYDLYDAIEVSRVAKIPKDYEGIMGVPITFLNKHNPEQFEIVGEANHGSDNQYDLFKPTVNGKLIYKRILIRRKK